MNISHESWGTGVTKVILVCVATTLATLGNASPVVAQQGPDIKFDHLTVEHGLSNNYVLGIVQDSRGFMWFATQNGLSKYDGYAFTIYRNNPADPQSLSNNFVPAVCEDGTGALWIGTWGGLNRFDVATEQFFHYRHDPEDAHSLSDDKIWALYEDATGMLWIGTERGGLNQFDRETEQFTRYVHDPGDPGSLSHNYVRALLEDSTGTLWVGTYGGGLNKFDRETGQFVHYRYRPGDGYSLSDDTVTALWEDSAGVVWVGTENGGLNQFDRQTERFYRYQHDPDDPQSLSYNNISAVLEDREGVLWVATFGGGLNRVERGAGLGQAAFIHYQEDAHNPQSLSGPMLRTLYEDQAGILWIGSVTGLNQFDRSKHKFAHYRHNANDPNSLSNDLVYSILEDHTGTVWVATVGGGLNKFDRATGQFTHYRSDPDDPHSLSDDTTRFVYEDRAGMLWIGTETGGLNQFNPETEHFVRYQHTPDNPHSLSHNTVWTVLEDQQGEVWVGTFGGGLNKLDRESRQFTHYQYDLADSGSLSDDGVTVLYEDSSGTLWVGTTGGVNVLDRENARFIRYLHDPDDPHSLNNNTILFFYEDSAGAFWIGTFGGLNRFERDSGTFINPQTDPTLPDVTLTGIVEEPRRDKTEDIVFWLSTLDNGLLKFNTRTGQTTPYDVGDGLQSMQFSISAACKGRDGALFFGGKNGLNMFYPADVQASTYIPPVVLTDFELFNQSAAIGPESPLPQSINVIDEIHLSYRDSVFSFEFAALHYSDPASNQYAYMLEGFDKDWTYTDAARRFATYTNLDGGVYTFRVKGSNSDGVWNDEGTALSVIIKPPFWETGWFRTLIGLTLVGGILGIYRARVTVLERQRQRLERQVAERTRDLNEAKEAAEVAREAAEVARQEAETADQAKSQFLSNMSHELRTPLNGILGYAQILKRDPLDARQQAGLDIIQQSGEHLLTLINDILDLSKIEAGKMDLYPADVHLPSFLNSIAGIIGARAEQKGIRFEFAPQDNLPTGVQADETRLRQVLLNLLGNAVKFTDSGQVTFRVSVTGSTATHNTLRFEITDTGVGMTEAQLSQIFVPFEQVGDAQRRAEGTGLGLAISRELVMAMGGTLHVESVYGQGSTFWFEITLPPADVAAQRAAPVGTVVGYTAERSLTVLVVDDKPYNRAILVNVLEPLGFVVTEAENGKTAVAQARERQPDLIMMDLIMPVMTGFEAVQAIRQIPALQKTTIIATSASVFERDRQASTVVGCDAFIPKPIHVAQLLDLIAQHLGVNWTYQAAPQGVRPQPAARTEASFEPPPPEELERLWELLLRGNLRGIREHAEQIGLRDTAYRPFAQHLVELASKYEEERIRALLERYREGER